LNVLTKIAIVVLLVVVLFACPVFITQAVVPANYKLAYERADSKAQLNAQEARAAYLALEAAKQELLDARKGSSDALDAARKKQDELQGQIASLTGEKNTLQSRIDSITATITKLRGDVKLLTELGEKRQTEIVEARKDIEKFAQYNSDLKKAHSVAVAQADRTEQVNKILREQIAQQKEEIKALEAKLASAGKAGVGADETAAAVASSDVAVSGTVTAIGPNETASINVGSAKGVQKNMKLFIYRGKNFVGYLRVGMVSADEAVGVVVDKRMDVMQGDKVASKLPY